MRKIFPVAGGAKGFTLVELMIVIIILGILSAIAVPMFLGQRTKAMFSEAYKNLEDIRLLQEQFRAEFGEYADKDVTSSGTLTGLAAIQAKLPGFKPGADNALRFNYSVQYMYNTTAQITDRFTATAVGKTGTPVAGSTFSINQDNVKSW